jgi:hypothetical protein
MNSLHQDFRFSLRVLAKTPGFTGATVIVLALGIGLNTAMFSVVYALAFSPRPFPAPERIVQLHTQDRKEPGNFRAFSFTEPPEVVASRTRRGGVRCSTCSWRRKASTSSWSAARERADVRKVTRSERRTDIMAEKRIHRRQ